METVEITYTVHGKLRTMQTEGYLDYLEENAKQVLEVHMQAPVEIIRIRVIG